MRRFHKSRMGSPCRSVFTFILTASWVTFYRTREKDKLFISTICLSRMLSRHFDRNRVMITIPMKFH